VALNLLFIYQHKNNEKVIYKAVYLFIGCVHLHGIVHKGEDFQVNV